MSKIGNISFKGIEQKPLNDNGTNVSNPVIKELGKKALPPGDRSLATSPSLPSEFLNETDLKRYKEVQKEWAENLAKELGVPVENILARLPEVQIGNAEEMLRIGHVASFDYAGNKIEMSPVRELVNLMGGAAPKVVHESTHGFSHNLRQAYARQIPFEQLCQEAASIVLSKMFEGEHGSIIKGFELQNLNGQQILVPQIMQAPLLAEAERKALINTINSLQAEHLNLETGNLKDAGKKFIQETLLPQLTEYSKQFENIGDKDNKISEKIINYIDAFFARRNLILNNLLSPNAPVLEKSIQKPLTEIEQNIARNTLKDVLSTQEGNIVQQNDPLNISDNSVKSYFMAYEERLARAQESLYRLEKVNKKISDIKAKGLEPAEALLKEKQTVEQNLKLLSLTDELDKIEKQIIGAEKSLEKTAEINRITQEIVGMRNNDRFEKFSEFFDADTLSKFDSEEALLKHIQKNLPPEAKNDFEQFIENAKKAVILNQKLKQLDSPEKLIAKTPKNAALKTQFDSILAKIKGIVKDCDLSGVPKQFFATEKDFLESTAQAIECIQKWARRLF